MLYDRKLPVCQHMGPIMHLSSLTVHVASTLSHTAEPNTESSHFQKILMWDPLVYGPNIHLTSPFLSEWLHARLTPLKETYKRSERSKNWSTGVHGRPVVKSVVHINLNL
ncbi:hypothetical protein PanWU01x14_123340 [Parasponia andersonii]|uniref:Uncharacterized protein n=1 Tax=Parasponia andersonii TaxID=3476 RepID=A0A2P5CU89_PARAD|nr:hypothetical protein PanWU01x14_123340 [Parasponia andersonii]